MRGVLVMEGVAQDASKPLTRGYAAGGWSEGLSSRCAGLLTPPPIKKTLYELKTFIFESALKVLLFRIKGIP
jgi:hypothetical protein